LEVVAMRTGEVPDSELATMKRHLREMAGGDAEVQAELSGLLVASLQRTRDGVQTAAAAGARTQLSEHAHAMRGAAGMAELVGVAGLAGRIELGQVPDELLAQEVTRLVAMVDQAIAAVRAWDGA
jgi:HPt (histidine-containing phosphotransfer) domain-containing protein